jgi:hypothetical protein
VVQRVSRARRVGFGAQGQLFFPSGSPCRDLRSDLVFSVVLQVRVAFCWFSGVSVGPTGHGGLRELTIFQSPSENPNRVRIL